MKISFSHDGNSIQCCLNAHWHWWWWSLPAVSSRAASEACDGLRWVWTLWHWKTEGLDFWEERSIWIELCSHPPKNIQIFSVIQYHFFVWKFFTQKNGIGWLNKRYSKTQRHIWDFHQIDFACQDLADTSFYWKWRDGALRGPFDPSKFSRTLAEMWHPLKAAIPQHQNHQKRFHPCVWRSYHVFVVFYQSVLVKDFEIDAWGEIFIFNPPIS